MAADTAEHWPASKLPAFGTPTCAYAAAPGLNVMVCGATDVLRMAGWPNVAPLALTSDTPG